jgi:hypothetical protein
MKEKSKQEFVLFEGNLLHKTDDENLLRRRSMLGSTLLRRARYWCYRYRNEATGGASATKGPEGFKKFVESLGGFGGWDLFADKWDIKGENPFIVVYRLMSVWQEWEQVMERVAIPIDSSSKEVAARMKILENQYKRG